MENGPAKSVTVKPNEDSKRKKQFSSNAQKRRRYILEPGLKGFLCSCNFREKDCIRESYNILNEYADLVYGPEGGKVEAEEIENVEEDIEGLLKEIESIKSVAIKGRRFQVVESGAKNLLFIRSTVDDPVKLAEMIVSDVSDKKKHKTRFLLRLVPVETTCKAYADEIKKAFEPLSERYFKDEPKSFSVVFNHRNNNSLSKEEVINGIAEVVKNTRSDHTVNLKQAEISVVVEVIKNIALLSVVPNFIKYKKYNLHTVCESDDAAAADRSEVRSRSNSPQTSSKGNQST